MNKKGIELLNYPIWILRIIFLAILIISIGFIVTKYFNVRVDVSKLETQIVLQRILNSNSIMYQDNVTQQIVPTIVDTNKLANADKNLTKELDFGKDQSHIAAKIVLQKRNAQNYLPNYLNKRLFQDLEPLLTSIFGTNVQQAQQTIKTFVYEDDQQKQDILTIQVLQQK